MLEDPNKRREFFDALGAMGAGLTTGNNWGQQLANANLGISSAVEKQRQTAQATQMKNQTLQMLQAQNPELAKAIQAGIVSPQDGFVMHLKQQQEAAKAKQPKYGFTVVNGQLIRTNETAGDAKKIGDFSDPNANMPASAKESAYWLAHPDEYTAHQQRKLAEEKAKNQQTASDLKPPTGFRFVNPADPNAGLEPIPGGPGEQLPGELAAKVGIADNFQKQLPAILKSVQDGKVTGVWDRGWAGYIGTGEGAETYRQIQSGVDALQRLLTGAGMNMAEATQYAQRYLPSYTDTPKSVTSKLNQLAQELESTKTMVMRGRGVDKNTNGADPLGLR